MKNLRNIILKIIFAGIALVPVNSVKALEIRHVPINQQQYPQAFPCGCIAISRALQNQGFSLPNATSRVQASIAGNAHGVALERSETLTQITNSLGLNMNILQMLDGQIRVAEVAIVVGQEGKFFENLIGRYKYSQQNQIHFVCFFQHPRGPHGFLITIDKRTNTLFVHTDPFATEGTPDVQAYAREINRLYEAATPKMAQQHQHPRQHPVLNEEHLIAAAIEASLQTSQPQPRDDELSRAIAASLATTQPQQDDLTRVLEASRLEALAAEGKRLEEERQARLAVERERQQLEEALRASEQIAPQTQVATLSEDQWARLIEVAPFLTDNRYITAANISDGLLEEGNLNYVLHRIR